MTIGKTLASPVNDQITAPVTANIVITVPGPIAAEASNPAARRPRLKGSNSRRRGSTVSSSAAATTGITSQPSPTIERISASPSPPHR